MTTQSRMPNLLMAFRTVAPATRVSQSARGGGGSGLVHYTTAAHTHPRLAMRLYLLCECTYTVTEPPLSIPIL